MCESAKPTPASNLRAWFSGYRKLDTSPTLPQSHTPRTLIRTSAAPGRASVQPTPIMDPLYQPAQYCLECTPVARHDTQSPGITMLGIMLTTSEAALCAKKPQAEGWQEAAT